MIARILATTIMFLLAVYAFVGNALGAGHYFNPFGILCLGLTALVWFKWEAVRDAVSSAKNESDMPIIRLGSTIIRGMAEVARKPRRRDHPRS
jgi:hypothetical protein